MRWERRAGVRSMVEKRPPFTHSLLLLLLLLPP